MVIKHKGKNRKYPYTYLICSNAMTGNGCKYHVLQYRQIERAVLTLLFSKVIPQMADSDSREQELLTRVGELKEAQKQKAKWVSIVEKSETVPMIATERLNFFSTKEIALKRKIESLAATIKEKPLANWQQIENTPEKRLRLQSVLSDAIEYLTIDAGKRAAILSIKDPACSFQIQWPKSTGTNGTTKNPANTYFYCDAFKNPMEYLDDVLVWKSPQNIKFQDLDNLVAPLTPRGVTVSEYLASEPIPETHIP
jgi:hypothetical protein